MLDVQNNRGVLSSDRYQSRGYIYNSIAITKKCTMEYGRSRLNRIRDEQAQPAVCSASTAFLAVERRLLGLNFQILLLVGCRHRPEQHMFRCSEGVH